MTEYLLILVLAGSLPFGLSFWPPLKFYRNIRPLFRTITSIVLIFGAWDVFAVYRGHWRFNTRSVMSIKLINLPPEEVLFFVVIPFCCIFTWEALLFLKKRSD
jgi:lycopene cyclase domain-containing protein